MPGIKLKDGQHLDYQPLVTGGNRAVHSALGDMRQGDSGLAGVITISHPHCMPKAVRTNNFHDLGCGRTR